VNEPPCSRLNSILKTWLLSFYLNCQGFCSRTGISCLCGHADNCCAPRASSQLLESAASGISLGHWFNYTASFFCSFISPPFPRPFLGLFKGLSPVLSELLSYQPVYHHLYPDSSVGLAQLFLSLHMPFLLDHLSVSQEKVACQTLQTLESLKQD